MVKLVFCVNSKRGKLVSLMIYSSSCRTFIKPVSNKIQTILCKSVLLARNNITRVSYRLAGKEECLPLSQVSTPPATGNIPNNERLCWGQVIYGWSFVPLEAYSALLSTASRTPRKATMFSRPSHTTGGLLTENQLTLPYHREREHPAYSATRTNSTLWPSFTLTLDRWLYLYVQEQ